MLFLSLLPAILSALLLAAHFLRAGQLPLAIVCLAYPLLFLVRRRWVPVVTHLALLAGALEWIRTELDALHRSIPNMSHPDAPVGADEKANLELFRGSTLPRAFDFKPLDHVQLGEKLGRKRIVSITRGRKEIWAAAIVYVIARLNFLFDMKNEFFLSADTICDFFGAKKSTVGSKASQIEKICNLGLGAEGFCSPDISDTLSILFYLLHHPRYEYIHMGIIQLPQSIHFR